MRRLFFSLSVLAADGMPVLNINPTCQGTASDEGA